MKLIEQFDGDELITIFEIARIALSRDTNNLADELDVNEEYLLDLSKKMESEMNYEDK